MASSKWRNVKGKTYGVLNKGTSEELRFCVDGIALNEDQLRSLLGNNGLPWQTQPIKVRGRRGGTGRNGPQDIKMEIKKGEKYRRKGDGAIITAIAPEEGAMGVNAWICRDETGTTSIVSVEDLLSLGAHA